MTDALTLFYSFRFNFLLLPPVTLFLSILIPYAPSVLPLFIVHITGPTQGYSFCLSYFTLPPFITGELAAEALAPHLPPFYYVVFLPGPA